jgi:hypothetical protein
MKGDFEMKVVRVSEANHGTICIAATVQDAIDYLFNMGWIDEFTDVWDGRDQCWVFVLDYFGPNWKNIISSMSLEEFNDVFEDGFTLYPTEVYERKP